MNGIEFDNFGVVLPPLKDYERLLYTYERGNYQAILPEVHE